jgi:hypothetical protein
MLNQDWEDAEDHVLEVERMHAFQLSTHETDIREIFSLLLKDIEVLRRRVSLWRDDVNVEEWVHKCSLFHVCEEEMTFPKFKDVNFCLVTFFTNEQMWINDEWMNEWIKWLKWIKSMKVNLQSTETVISELNDTERELNEHKALQNKREPTQNSHSHSQILRHDTREKRRWRWESVFTVERFREKCLDVE